jgi:Xaa-Pro aminopeptidase
MLLDTVPGAGHGFAGSTIGQLRMIKSASEFAALKRSAAVADAVLVSLAKTLIVGLRESDVADRIRDAFKSHGAQPEFAIVGASENGAMPHHEGSDRRIKDGDIMVIDIGGTRFD